MDANTYPIGWAKRWLKEFYKGTFGDPEDRPGTPEHTNKLRRQRGLPTR